MAAEALSYFKKFCAENGGWDEVIYYNLEDRITLELDGKKKTITNLVLADGAKAHRIVPDMESIGLGDNSNRSRENNSKMVTQSGVIIFKDDDDDTVELIEEFSIGFWGVIGKKSRADGTSVWRHFGVQNGMTMETSEGALAQLYEDLRGHTLNLVGKELTKAPSIADGLVQSLLIPNS